MACYISFVNISKSISSDPDLPWYTEQYLEAGNLSYIQYVMGLVKWKRPRVVFSYF